MQVERSSVRAYRRQHVVLSSGRIDRESGSCCHVGRRSHRQELVDCPTLWGGATQQTENTKRHEARPEGDISVVERTGDEEVEVREVGVSGGGGDALLLPAQPKSEPAPPYFEDDPRRFIGRMVEPDERPLKGNEAQRPRRHNTVAEPGAVVR